MSLIPNLIIALNYIQLGSVNQNNFSSLINYGNGFTISYTITENVPGDENKKTFSTVVDRLFIRESLVDSQINVTQQFQPSPNGPIPRWLRFRARNNWSGGENDFLRYSANEDIGVIRFENRMTKRDSTQADPKNIIVEYSAYVGNDITSTNFSESFGSIITSVELPHQYFTLLELGNLTFTTPQPI